MIPSKIKPDFFQGSNPNSPLSFKLKINEIIDSLNDDFIIGPTISTDNAIARFNGITGELIQNSSVTIDDSGIISGATIGNTNTAIFKDNLFTIQDNSDSTKQLQFQLSGITTATTRTLTVPDASNTLVLTTVGTANYFPFFSGNGFTLANSILQQSGTTTAILGTGAAATDYILKFNGNTTDANLTWDESQGTLGLTSDTSTYFEYPGWKALYNVSQKTDIGSSFTAWLEPSFAGSYFSSFFGGMQDRGASTYSTAYAVGVTGYNYINGTNARTHTFLCGGENTTEFGGACANVTVTDLVGTHTWAGITYGSAGSITVTNAYGLKINDVSGFTPTNNYGLYINSITGGTTDYAIYTNTGAIRFGDSVTMADAKNLIFNTTTGTKIGTATTQKLSFYNSTPIVQPLATTDLGTVLSNLGLRASGTAYPITTSGAVSFTGGLTISTTGLTITDVNVILSATTGTKFGTATTQKLSFWNATPIVQPTTAVAGATFTVSAGTAVNDASTFDGYTIKQVVKALRNTGILA